MAEASDANGTGEEGVRAYQEFLEKRVKADLEGVKEQRRKLEDEDSEYKELARNVEAMEREGTNSFRSLVDLGGEVYCKADVEDATKVFVAIGLGFYAEMTRSEAANFCAKKRESLQRQIRQKYEQESRLRAHAKLLQQGIAELLGA